MVTSLFQCFSSLDGEKQLYYVIVRFLSNLSCLLELQMGHQMVFPLFSQLQLYLCCNLIWKIKLRNQILFLSYLLSGTSVYISAIKLWWASASPGGCVKTPINGAHSQRFWFSSSGVRPDHLHFCNPRWCWCCWSGVHTLRTTSLC